MAHAEAVLPNLCKGVRGHSRSPNTGQIFRSLTGVLAPVRSTAQRRCPVATACQQAVGRPGALLGKRVEAERHDGVPSSGVTVMTILPTWPPASR